MNNSVMIWFERSFSSPYDNIACDEALLLLCEAGECGPALRFWSVDEPFVVIGRSNRVEREVDVEACKRMGAAIARRSSGGGSVVIGAGCLNYTLALPIEAGGPIEKIDRTYQHVLSKHVDALKDAAPGSIAIQGISDLALDGRKFSGNSQRRKKRFVLFHGTFLLSFDIQSVSSYLPMPSKQPDYRSNRGHSEFLTNLNVDPELVKAKLREVWNCERQHEPVSTGRVQELSETQFATDSWIYQF